MTDIPIKKTDPNFKVELARRPGAENIKKCFSCGTCTGACPVFRVESGYNPRKLIRQILLGLREEVLSSHVIWLCARCYACTAHCPQGVSFADIMAVLQDMAVKEGYAPADLAERIEFVTQAASSFRRDCIRMACGDSTVTGKDVLENVKRALEEM